ncbi:MAG: hypothetical protein Q9214_004563, partial [Letrouitia sp. 1 TL-2023]
DAALARFRRQMHDFHTAFAHVSHEPAGEMLFAHMGSGVAVVDHGDRDNELDMPVQVLLHTWKSKEDEVRYKSRKGDEYEGLFLGPVREMEALGVQRQEGQVLLEPVRENVVEEGGRRCAVM